MIYHYWTISYRPAPMSLSVYGIGVVVGDPETGEFKHKTVPRSASRVPLRQGRDVIHDAVAEFVHELDRLQIPANNPIQFSTPMDPRSFLNRATTLFQNHLIVRGPMIVEHESLVAAVDFLFETLVEEKPTETRPQKRTIVKRAILSEYESREIISSLTVEDPTLLLPNELDRDLDVAVLGEEIYELDFAFNFGGEPNRAVRDYADSWALRVTEIREGRASIEINESNRIKVGSEVPVTAVIYPPSTEKQQELFRMSTALWRELNIDIVDFRHLPSHASSLASRIAS